LDTEDDFSGVNTEHDWQPHAGYHAHALQKFKKRKMKRGGKIQNTKRQQYFKTYTPGKRRGFSILSDFLKSPL
jgi:hypothetical protein